MPFLCFLRFFYSFHPIFLLLLAASIDCSVLLALFICVGFIYTPNIAEGKQIALTNLSTVKLSFIFHSSVSDGFFCVLDFSILNTCRSRKSRWKNQRSYFFCLLAFNIVVVLMCKFRFLLFAASHNPSHISIAFVFVACTLMRNIPPYAYPWRAFACK